MCMFSADVKMNDVTVGLSYKNKLKENTHGIFYSNNVDNLSDGTNSMLLSFPVDLSNDGNIEFLDSTYYAYIIDDIREYFTPKTRSISLGMLKSLNKIQTVGAYTLTFCDSEHLIKMYKKLKIPFNIQQLNFMIKKHPNWIFLICKWVGKNVATEQPIWVEYTPLYPKYLHFPMIDAHNGEIPKNGTVDTNHLLSFYHPNMSINPNSKNYLKLSDKTHFLGNNIFVTDYYEKNDVENGDLWIECVEDLSDAFYGNNTLSFKEFDTPQQVLDSVL